MGFLNPALYAIGKDPARYASAFHDVSVGNVVNNCGLGLQTTAGYDLTTGWGTPQCGAISAIIGATPVVTAGVSTAAQGGALICLTGKQFTPGGTVTIDYLGVPELAGTANPVQTVTSTLQVAADGTCFESDNEIQTIAGYVAAGAAGCRANGVGTVSVRVTDNSTGAIGTTTLPTRVFCRRQPRQSVRGGGGLLGSAGDAAALRERGRASARACLVRTGGLRVRPGPDPRGRRRRRVRRRSAARVHAAALHGDGRRRRKGLDRRELELLRPGRRRLLHGRPASSRVTVILTDKATGNTAKNTLDAELVFDQLQSTGLW